MHQTCGDKYSDKVKEKNDKLTFIMPTDVKENGISKLFVSIHYYDPLGWGIAKTAATSDIYRWHSHFQLSDWSQLKEPCIRITMHDDDISKSAQLQLVYTNGHWQGSSGE